MHIDGLELKLNEDDIEICIGDKSMLLKDKADLVALIYERANEIKSLGDLNELVFARFSKSEQKKFSELINGIMVQ